MNIIQRFTSFLRSLFSRKNEIELSVKVAKALISFSESSVDDIIVYVLTALYPTTTTATSLIKSFLTNDLPTILKVLELMDASDESTITQENITKLSKEIKTMGTILDETALSQAIEKSMSDGKLSFWEAKELLSNYITN